MGSRAPNAATEVTSTANSPVFPTILEYDTLWEAFTICFHNAMRILLLQLLGTLKPFSTFHSILLDDQNSTALLGITSNTRGLSCEILRSLRYSYRMFRRFVYTFSFLVISDVAYGWFDRESGMRDGFLSMAGLSFKVWMIWRMRISCRCCCLWGRSK